MNQKVNILTSLQANIPEEAKEMFLDNLRGERLRYTERIKEKLNTQDLFHSEENIEQLIKASPKQISELAKKWESGETEKHQQKIKWLNALERDKKALEQLDKTIKSLVQQNNEFTIYDLLELMFNIILCTLTKRTPEATKSR